MRRECYQGEACLAPTVTDTVASALFATTGEFGILRRGRSLRLPL